MVARADGPERGSVTFGSASLLEASTDTVAARAVLESAVDAGADRLDAAPMYGHGLTEPLVLEVGKARGVPVTTKAGIEPRKRASRFRRTARAAVLALPPALGGMARRAAGAASADPFSASGRFGVDAVRASVERSLRRAGRLDRLLLHEVQPPDVTDELLELLSAYRDRGDVAELGCATRNVITGPVLDRGAGVLVVAHVSTAPLGSPLPPVRAGVRLVGHGAFGVGGADLRLLTRALEHDGGCADAWAAAVAGTPFAGEGGLPRALLARARAQGVAEVLVATTRAERVERLVQAAGSMDVLGPQEAEVLEGAIARLRNDDRGGNPC